MPGIRDFFALIKLGPYTFKRIAWVSVAVLFLDQITKSLIVRWLDYAEQHVVLHGFFKLVYWGNTGAAWSLFYGNNMILAVVAFGALLLLLFSHHHFDSHTTVGQIALGLMFGGIIGNLTDRLTVGHVIDFIYFYVQRRGGGEIGFPAFNVADAAICTGVGLIFLLSWRNESGRRKGERVDTTNS